MMILVLLLAFIVATNAECHIDHCQICFSPTFCSLCEDPYLTSGGQCIKGCQRGKYYGQFTHKCRDKDCQIDHCQRCFSQYYCIVCEDPYLASEGQCIEECPRGLYYDDFMRECKDKVDCLPGAWSPWSVCKRNGQTCGFKWGVQLRAQKILQNASPNGALCPEVTGTQRCRLQQRHCDERNRRKRHRRKHKQKGRRRKKPRRPCKEGKQTITSEAKTSSAQTLPKKEKRTITSEFKTSSVQTLPKKRKCRTRRINFIFDSTNHETL